MNPQLLPSLQPNQDVSPGDRDHTYHYALPLIALHVVLFVPAGMMVVLLAYILRFVLPSLASQVREQPVILLCIWILVPNVPILMIMSISALTIAGNGLFTRLRVSPRGLDFRYWPSYGIRCSWADIDILCRKRSLGIFPFDKLILRQAEPYGLPIAMAMRRMIGMSTRYIIPLTGLSGWPEGKLAEDLRRYTPELFVAQGA